MRYRIVALFYVQLATLVIGFLAAVPVSPAQVRPADVPAAATLPANAGVAIRTVTQEISRDLPPSSKPVARPPARAQRPAVAGHRHPRPPKAAVTAAAPLRPRALAAPATGAVSTPRQRLDAAIARIPGYQEGDATWILQADDGHWGTADWYRNIIWFSPSVPAKRTYDVAIHDLPPPMLGQHTDEVLREVLGRSEADIATLRAKGAI